MLPIKVQYQVHYLLYYILMTVNSSQLAIFIMFADDTNLFLSAKI